MHFPNHPNIKYDIFDELWKKAASIAAIQQKEEKSQDIS